MLRGQVIYIAPRSNSIERKFIVAPDLVDQAARNEIRDINSYLASTVDTTPFRVYDINHVPGITAKTELDGDKIIAFKDPSALLFGPIADQPERIDELRAFFTNGDVSQVFHRFDPWTYSATPQILHANISDAEESSIVSSITGDYVEITLQAYLSNGAVGRPLTYRMAINPAFLEPTGGGGSGGGVTAGQLSAERTARSNADASLSARIDANATAIATKQEKRNVIIVNPGVVTPEMLGSGQLRFQFTAWINDLSYWCGDYSV